jgi:SAM-dependent methyltransferase
MQEAARTDFAHNVARDRALKLFKLSFLKQAKLKEITRMLEPMEGKRGFDIGADNGAISFLLRQRGGTWISGDLDETAVASIRSLVGEGVVKLDGGQTQFDKDYFDLVLIIDFLEHIATDRLFVREVSRILKKGGLFIVHVPHKKRWGLIRPLRNALGLTDEQHGHLRPGYTLDELRKMLEPAFVIEAVGTYSRFFSQLIDALMSFLFVHLKKGASSRKGVLLTQQDLGQFSKQIRLYTWIYPVIWFFAQLDRLLFLTKGYNLLIRARLADKA